MLIPRRGKFTPKQSARNRAPVDQQDGSAVKKLSCMVAGVFYFTERTVRNSNCAERTALINANIVAEKP
jgi:hypothetical protein